MNNIIQTIRHTARAAAVLLIALLAAQTAWAQKTKTVTDAHGLETALYDPTLSLVNVTDNITGVGGLPPLNRDLTINLNGHTISGDGLLIYVGTGHSLTINGGGQDDSVGNITSGYAGETAINNGGTVSLRNVNITTNSAYAIGGTGTLYIGDNVSFNGWTQKPFKTEDVNITGNYSANVVTTVNVGGTPHYFENIDAALAYIVSHPDNDDFSLSGTTYTIHTATGWGLFCDMLANRDQGFFTGKTVQLGADIGTADDPVSRMAGSKSSGNEKSFTGTFDGNNKKLTFTAEATDNYVAPFCNVAGTSSSAHAVVRNLNVVTTITANDFRHVAGLIAIASGYVDVSGCNATVNITANVGNNNTNALYPAGLVSQAVSPDELSESQLTVSGCTVSGTITTDGQYAGGLIGITQCNADISDCLSSVTIQSSTAIVNGNEVNHDGSHGGLISGTTGDGCTVTIEGCVFNGKLLSTNSTNNCGGFVGWRNSGLEIRNSLFDPAQVTISNTGCATFARNDGDTHNCYYTYLLCDGTNYKPGYDEASSVWRNGKACHSVTAGHGVTIGHAGVATKYTVTGITAYKDTDDSSAPFTEGLLYDGVLYAGSADHVSLTITDNAGTTTQGYQDNGYTASAGTLSGSVNPYTLTMPDEDVTVTFDRQVLPWTGDGSKGNPFIIYNKDQLNLLAQRVNSGTGDDYAASGYSGKYFKLGADITYDPKELTIDNDNDRTNDSNYEAIGDRYDLNRFFNGNFDGGGHTVSGIRIYKGGSSDADKYQGLFGRTDPKANIHDVTLANANITGYDTTGGIVGFNYCGTISRCHVADDVAVCAVQPGAFNHGGIVGYNSSGTIEHCTSAATLTTSDATSTRYYGGIAGHNESGTLRDNLAIGATVPAAAENTYGAICGVNSQEFTLENNYYTACKVAGVENATGVGCGNDDEDYTVADVNNVNNPNGAVPALRDNADNSTAIGLFAALASTANGHTPVDLGWGAGKYPMQLAGRKLYKDGSWNTLCLPFDVVLEGSPLDGDGVKAMTLNTATSSLADGTLTLNFTEATSIEAGTPFIVKWNTDGEDIENPVFEGVTVSNTTNAATVEGVLTFTGTYAPVSIGSDGDNTKLYLGAANTLYYPKNAMTIGSQRAYFQLLDGLTAGEPNAVRAFVLNFFDEEASGIAEVKADADLKSASRESGISNPLQREWYTLDGRRLSGKPTRSGLYIHNGKSFVIK